MFPADLADQADKKSPRSAKSAREKIKLVSRRFKKD
jgi:hypothetical protein